MNEEIAALKADLTKTIIDSNTEIKDEIHRMTIALVKLQESGKTTQKDIDRAFSEIRALDKKVDKNIEIQMEINKQQKEKTDKSAWVPALLGAVFTALISGAIASVVLK